MSKTQRNNRLILFQFTFWHFPKYQLELDVCQHLDRQHKHRETQAKLAWVRLGNHVFLILSFSVVCVPAQVQGKGGYGTRSMLLDTPVDKNETWQLGNSHSITHRIWRGSLCHCFLQPKKIKTHLCPEGNGNFFNRKLFKHWNLLGG